MYYRNLISDKLRLYSSKITDIRKKESEVIVLVSRSRSGSNLLKNYLNQHPQIILDGELLGSVEDGKLFEKIDELMEKSNLCYRYTGFKFFFYHPMNSNIEKNAIFEKIFLGNKNIKIIHLFRSNLYSMVKSREISKQTGLWINRGEKPVERDLILSETDMIKDAKRTVENENHFKQFIELNNLSSIDVCFENLVKDKNLIMSNIFNFLNLQCVKCNAQFDKTSGRYNIANNEIRLREIINEISERRTYKSNI